MQDALHRAQERTGKDGPGGAEVAEAIELVRELKAQAGRLAQAAHQGVAYALVADAVAGQPRLDPFGLYARRNTGGSGDAT